MTSNLDRTALYNMVADMLVDAEIPSADGTSKVVRAIRRWEPIVRDQLLTEQPWRFARQRSIIARDVATPAFEWDYQYHLPAGCLMLFSLQYDGYHEGTPIAHEIEQDGSDKLIVLTDEAGPLKIRWIKRVDNVGAWHPLFAMAWAARVGKIIAPKIAGKASYIDRLAALEKEALDKAQAADAIMGTPERAVQDEWETERYVGWRA
jgi:hypothetical protein